MPGDRSAGADEGRRRPVDLTPPGADALDRLIRQPAALAGLCFEQRGDTSLADVIVRDATAHNELLPLLEYLLDRLCAERTKDGVLTVASYKALGGVEGTLARRADAVLAGLRPSEATVDALLAALITLSGDEQKSFVRRRVPRVELERDEASRALVAALIGERLLTSSAPVGGPAIVTVAHEALFRVWSHAVAWLGRNREFLRLRANVTQSLVRWQNAEEDDSLLLPAGLPLEEAGRLLEIEAGRLQGSTRNYIEASFTHQKAQEARRLKRRRAVLASLSVLTLLSVAGAVMAFCGYRESSLNLEQAYREKQRAETEAAKARAETRAAEEANNAKRLTLHEASVAAYAMDLQRLDRDDKWSEGIAYLARALEQEPGNTFAAMRLYSAIADGVPKYLNGPWQVIRRDDQIMSAAFRKDGAALLVAGKNGTAQQWDLASGKAFGPIFRHEKSIRSASYSPDGTRILTASEDKTARLWDAVSGQLIGQPMVHTDIVKSAVFSPDGSKIGTVGLADVTAFIWDAATCQQIGSLKHELDVASLAFNADDSLIVTACADKTARLWDVPSLQPYGTPLVHPDGVPMAIFGPQGFVITACWDNKVRIWNPATGQTVGTPYTHSESIDTVTISSDGSKMVTAEPFGDGIQIWNTDQQMKTSRIALSRLSRWR